MDISKIHKQGRKGHSIVKYSALFLLLHTIFFLVRDGWHYKAITMEEKICDGLSVLGICIGLFIMLTALFNAVNALLIELNKLVKDHD